MLVVHNAIDVFRCGVVVVVVVVVVRLRWQTMMYDKAVMRQHEAMDSGRVSKTMIKDKMLAQGISASDKRK